MCGAPLSHTCWRHGWEVFTVRFLVTPTQALSRAGFEPAYWQLGTDLQMSLSSVALYFTRRVLLSLATSEDHLAWPPLALHVADLVPNNPRPLRGGKSYDLPQSVFFCFTGLRSSTRS